MFHFAGVIIKNDAKKTDLFPHRVFLLTVEGGCTQVTAKNTCDYRNYLRFYGRICSDKLIFSTVSLIS